MKIVGLGGTYRAGSSTERCLRRALQGVGEHETVLLGAEALDLPIYRPEDPERHPKAARLIAELRRADGVIIATPAYHAGISGMVKNALDYIEDLRGDARPYLHGRAVGCVVAGAGWQATTATLLALRAVVHALRAWPTPLGVAVNTTEVRFADDGSASSAAVDEQLTIMAGQVVEFARRWQAPGG